MIKLIVSDIDNTLIGSKRSLPSDFGRVMAALKEKGVTFAIATGRDYNGSVQFFGDYKDDLYFICDNGANIYKGDKLLKTCTIDPAIIREIVRAVKDIDNADPMLCTHNGTFIAHGHEAFNKKMAAHYSPTTLVDDLDKFSEGVFKLSVYDSSESIKDNSYIPLSEKFGDKMTVHLSWSIWVDMMDKSADKGKGVEYLQALLGVTKEETMAFGDYYNDIPLFDRAGYPYVMENAPDDLKSQFPLHAPACDEDGLTKVIWDKVLG